MNKTVVISVVVVLLLILLGVGGYFLLGDRDTNSVADTSNVSTASEETAASQPQSLRELMSYTSNQTCTFSHVDGKSEGSVYVGNGKMRGDFIVTEQNVKTASHMISDATNVYVWLEGTETGFKGNLDAMTKASATNPAAGSNDVVNPDEKVDFKCTNWVVDQTRFDLPTNVTFTDINSLIPSGMPATTGQEGTDIKAAQCSSCNSLPAEAVAQCKQALGC